MFTKASILSTSRARPAHRNLSNQCLLKHAKISIHKPIRATAASQEGSMTKVSISVSVPLHVAYGEHLKLVGSDELLGGWQVDAAPELCWTEGDVWKLSVELPAGTESEYKLVHCMPGQVIWEYTDNRVLKIPEASDEPYVLDLVWCDPGFTTATIIEEKPVEEIPVTSEEETDGDLALVTPAFSVEPVEAIVDEKKEEEEEEEEANEVQGELVTDVETPNEEEEEQKTETPAEGGLDSEKLLKGAAKTAGYVALGVAGAAVMSALAVDVADAAILGAMAAAAGGAALSSSSPKTKKSKDDVKEQTEVKERNITGAGEAGVIIAAGLMSALDAGKSVADSLDKKADPEADTTNESS